MGETSRTRELCKTLRERRGMEFYPLIASQWSPPGWPDRLFSHKICALCLVEWKDWDTPTSPLQLRRLKELQRACIARFHKDYKNSDGHRLVRLETETERTEYFDALRFPEMLMVFHAAS
jgi:hypothetical protein